MRRTPKLQIFRGRKMQEKDASGLVVQLNFRPTEFHSSGTQVQHWSSGTARNVETGEYYMFNTHGQLLDRMGKWHVEKYRANKRFRITDQVVTSKTKTEIVLNGGQVSKAARLKSAATRSISQTARATALFQSCFA